MESQRGSAVNQDKLVKWTQIDFSEALEHITPLTKAGAACFLAGKAAGVVAISAVIVPALHAYAVAIVVVYASLILAAIVLCGVDYYVFIRPGRVAVRKMAEIRDFLVEHPELRERILAEPELKATPKVQAKVISLGRVSS